MKPASALASEPAIVQKTLASRNRATGPEGRIEAISFRELDTEMMLMILKSVEPALQSDLFHNLSRHEVLRVAQEEYKRRQKPIAASKWGINEINRFLIRKQENYRILHFEEGEKIWSARHSHRSEYIWKAFEEARDEHVEECSACQLHRRLLQTSKSEMKDSTD
eukprot:s1083_g7.t1